MKKTQIVAALAFSFMLGAAIPIIQLSTASSVVASEAMEEGASSAAEGVTDTESAEGTSDDVADVTNGDVADDNTLDDNTTDGNVADDNDAGQTTPIINGVMAVTTEAMFAEALANAEVNKIVLEADLDVVASGIIERDLTIDLNGHSITNQKGVPVAVYSGKVTLTGSGVLHGRGWGNGLEVFGSTENVSSYSVVTIGEGVILKSDAMYGLSILPNASSTTKDSYGIVIDFAGRMEAPYGFSIHGSIQHHANCPEINILDSAEIISITESDSTPIYAAGVGNWQIGAAKLRGKTGLGIRAGRFDFAGTNIEIDGEMREPNTGSGGIDGVGAVFQIEHHKSYADAIVLDINGGTYRSVQGDVFYEYGDLGATRAAKAPADINIKAGSFIAGPGREIFGGTIQKDDIEIWGGTFKGADVAQFQENGYLKENLKVDENGTVVADVKIDPVKPDTNTDEPMTDNPTEDENKNDEADLPNTGARRSRGIASAVATATPVVLLLGAAAVFYSGRILKRRYAARMAEIDCEISQMETIEKLEPSRAVIDEDDEEPVIERFVAVPIEREEKKLPQVDVFVPKD